MKNFKTVLKVVLVCATGQAAAALESAETVPVMFDAGSPTFSGPPPQVEREPVFMAHWGINQPPGVFDSDEGTLLAFSARYPELDLGDIEFDEFNPLENAVQTAYVWSHAEASFAVRDEPSGHRSRRAVWSGGELSGSTGGAVFGTEARFVFGSNAYTEASFDRNPAEVVARRFNASNPVNGLDGAGIDSIAPYRVRDQFWFGLRVRWEQLQGEAANAPIVDIGKNHRSTISIGLHRSFPLDS